MTMTAVRYAVDGSVLEEIEVPPRAAELRLQPHPEGGWYRRTWTSPATVETAGGQRPTATTVLFLLPPGETSAWHRVTSDELWLWHGPGDLAIVHGGSGEAAEPELRVVLDAANPQAIIPGGMWQRTLPAADEVLVTCVVSPGFDFADFTLA